MHAKQSGGIGSSLLSGVHELHNFSLLTGIEFGATPADPSFLSSRDQSMTSTLAQHGPFELLREAVKKGGRLVAEGVSSP
jgi:hypothetical protein